MAMAKEAAAPAASAEGTSVSSKKAASVSAPAVSATAAGAKTTSGPAGISSAGLSSHGNPTYFDVDSAQPKDVDFLEWVPEEHSGKVQKRSDKGDTQLAKRLMLQAFSTMIGWRPTGLNVGQARLFIERFPSEFRIGAMSKIILPCHGWQPYVCPDGKLPCPCLSTCTALRMIEKRKVDIPRGKFDPMASKEIVRVISKGVQVEWMEFEGYISYMLF